LPKQDQDIIMKLGLKFRGRNAYPIFRNLKPGYLPLTITADEAAYFAHALTQAADVCMRFKKQVTLLDHAAPDHYFVRTPEINGEAITWSDQ
jgi:hypothetical protein